MSVEKIDFMFNGENLTEKYVLACFFLAQLVKEIEPDSNITMDNIEESLNHAVESGDASIHNITKVPGTSKHVH